MPVGGAPPNDLIKVRIEDVDITQRLAHCFDKTNGRIQVWFRDVPGGGLLRIPRQGEIWVAERRGYIWHLKNRLHIPDQQDYLESIASPGDAHIETSGTVYMNGRPVGAWVNQVFTSATEYTGIVLTYQPANPGGIQLFINGLLIAPNLWTIDGNSITFDVLMSAGVIVAYYETLDNAVYYEAALS